MRIGGLMGSKSFDVHGQSHPDPVRAHGAWIILFASVAAGAFVGTTCAVLPAFAAVMLAKTLGFLSRPAVVSGIAALALAAPVVAVAGDASLARGAMLFGFLWPFFCWRALAVVAPLADGAAWDRKVLRSRGLREAAITGGWSLFVALGLRMVNTV